MPLSRSSTSSLSVSDLVPATRPCRMHRAPPSASTVQVCSTRLRSLHPSSPTTFDDQAHGLSAAAALFTISVLATTNLSPNTQPRAPTTAARSFDPPQALHPHGRTAFSCPSRHQRTTADTHGSAEPTCPASLSSQRHQPSLTNPDLPSCLRKMTRTFP